MSARTARIWAERQNDLIARLEAPYALRIQRTIWDLLNDGNRTERDKASELLVLADHLGLARQPAPRRFRPSTSTTFT